jgi:hypothetical protein
MGSKFIPENIHAKTKVFFELFEKMADNGQKWRRA